MTEKYTQVDCHLVNFLSENINKLMGEEFGESNKEKKPTKTFKLYDPDQKVETPAEKQADFYTFKTNEQENPE